MKLILAVLLWVLAVLKLANNMLELAIIRVSAWLVNKSKAKQAKISGYKAEAEAIRRFKGIDPHEHYKGVREAQKRILHRVKYGSRN